MGWYPGATTSTHRFIGALFASALWPIQAPAQCDWTTPFPGGGLSTTPFAVCVFDEDGGGPGGAALFAGGSFTIAGTTPVAGVARWDGTKWSAVGSGVSGPTPAVFAMTTFDPDEGGSLSARLIVGGLFFAAGGVTSPNAAAWDGEAWMSMSSGPGLGLVRALAVVDLDGPGPASATLFAGGDSQQHNPSKWAGGAWVAGTSPPAGVAGNINAMVGFDDDGSGPHTTALYVGGAFQSAGTVAASGIAKWDGSAWSPLGTGLTSWGFASALAVFDQDKAGPAQAVLVVAGRFNSAGGTPALSIAAWNGSDWSPLAGGLSGPLPRTTVRTLAAVDTDGRGLQGPDLFAGGDFTLAGGLPANYVARWNSAAWSPLAEGTSNSVYSLAGFDEDDAGPLPPGLIVGGFFNLAGGQPSPRIARWVCDACYADCTGESALTIADFACFQTKLVAQDLYADCNHDGSLTIADFGCFQTSFVQGCP